MADPFPPSGRTRLLRWLLVVSLAINLAVIGMALGFMLRDHTGRPPRGFDMTLGHVGRALAPEDRAALRDALKARADIMPPRRAREADLAVLVIALTQDPYDPDALREALSAPVRRAAKVQAVAATVLASRIDAMTDQARAALAARLTESRPPR